MRVSVPAAVTAVPAMLSREERQYLIWLTSTQYEGWGAVVDLGPWLGGSTAALAEGLRRRGKGGVVHSLDLFRWEPDYMGPVAAEPLEEGADFQHVFARHTAPWASFIQARQADLSRFRWEGGPIELLFVDAAKTWELANAILAGFGDHLIPGRSRVVLQDFRYHETHWLPLIFDSQPDLWHQLESVQDGWTVTFEPLRALRRDGEPPRQWGDRDFPIETVEPLLRRRMDQEDPGNAALFLRMLYRRVMVDGSPQDVARLRNELRSTGIDARELARIEDVATLLIPAGWQAYDRGDFARARELAERAIVRRTPRPVWGVALLGMSLLKLGELEAARPCIEDVASRMPDVPDAWLYRAELALTSGAPDSTEEDVLHAIALREEWSDSMLHSALTLLASAWRLTPLSPSRATVRADLERRFAGRGALDALHIQDAPIGGGILDAAGDREPLAEGWAAFDRGDYGAARDVATRMHAGHPEHPNESLALFGMSLLRLGDTDAARPVLRGARTPYAGHGGRLDVPRRAGTLRRPRRARRAPCLACPRAGAALARHHAPLGTLDARVDLVARGASGAPHGTAGHAGRSLRRPDSGPPVASPGGGPPWRNRRGTRPDQRRAGGGPRASRCAVAGSSVCGRARGDLRMPTCTAALDTPSPGRAEVTARLALVAAASLITAICIARTVAAPGTMRPASPAEYRIMVQPSRAQQGQLWLNRLLIDGRRRSIGPLTDSSEWHAEPFDPTVEPLFRMGPGLETAAIHFEARRFVLVTHSAGFAGSITVLRDGVPIRRQQLTPTDSVAFIDPFMPPTTEWRIALALLATGLLAFGWRPWRGGRRAVGWLATLLGGAHLAFWLTMAFGTTNDSPEYLVSLEALRNGVPSYFPPGYPGFLGVLRLLGGARLPLLVTFVQHLFVVIAAAWLFLIMRRMVSESLALGGGLLAGGLAAAFALPQVMMSEAPTLFATVGTLWFAIRLREHGRRRDALFGGLLLGWAGLLRVVPALALAPACGLLLLVPWRERRLRQFTLMLTTAAVLVVTPLLWFDARSGRPALANSSSLHLFNRVVAQQQLLDISAPATQRLLQSLGGSDPRGLAWWDTWARLQASEMPDSTFEALLGETAMEGIRSDPVGFLGYVPRLAWQELMSEPSAWTPRWGESMERHPPLEPPALVPVTATGLAWRSSTEVVARLAWPVIGWIATLGMVSALWHRDRILTLALATVPILYLLGTATLEAFDARYNYPVSTLLIALAMVFLDCALRIPDAVRSGGHRMAWRNLVNGWRVVLERAGRLAPDPRGTIGAGDATPAAEGVIA